MLPEESKYALRTCVWEITLACCFSCAYCGSSGGQAREGELTTEECFDVARQLADLGCRRVSLIGGEAFMRPDWADIARALTSRGVRVSIITNGYTLSAGIIAAIKSAGISSVAVSLDGPKAIHDKYRQIGSYDRAMGALHALVKNGISASVISTLNAESVFHLAEMYETLERSGIFAWQLQACSPMGNAAKGGVDYQFDPMMPIRFVESHAPTAPFVVGIADNIGYFTSSEGYLRGNLSGMAVFRGCQAGRSAIGIDSVGNVRGCESMYDEVFNEGNLRAKTLREIWEAPDAFSYNRGFGAGMLTGSCARCEYGSLCAGGCRSYNYFSHGKLYEAPRCAKRERDSSAANVCCLRKTG